MPSSRARAADIKLLISATVGVLLAGFLVAGGVYAATRSKNSVVCGQLNIGSATNVRQLLQSGGPYFQTGGAGCGFWLALADGNIVAYKVEQPQGCSLQLKRDHWECGSQTVPVEDLAQYDVSIQTVGQTDSVIIDLLPPGVEPTTTSTAVTQSLLCETLKIGTEADVRKALHDGGPLFQTGGEKCGFWLDVDHDVVVAYKANQPQGCTLMYERDHWACGSKTVAVAGLSRYPLTTQTVGKILSLVVDFRKG